MSGSTFKHSGDLGDIIFALPTIRALGGGVLYLDPDGGMSDPFVKWRHLTRTRLNAASIGELAPLLRQQPYITDVRHWLGEPVDHNLDQFRAHLRFDNLADSHLAAFGLPLTHRDTPWLRVGDPVRVPGKDLVIARSLKNQGNHAFWEINVDGFRPRAIFVGLPIEHQAFTHVFGPIEHYPTPDLLTLARVIAGAATFIGNVSFPHALAEAMKKPMHVEYDRTYCPVIFRRPGVTYV
jgi:hypothetical protein